MEQNEFMNKVAHILKERFPDIEIELDILSNGRISGYVSSAAFTGLDQMDRQNILRDLLNQKLGIDAKKLASC